MYILVLTHITYTVTLRPLGSLLEEDISAHL